MVDVTSELAGRDKEKRFDKMHNCTKKKKCNFDTRSTFYSFLGFLWGNLLHLVWVDSNNNMLYGTFLYL